MQITGTATINLDHYTLGQLAALHITLKRMETNDPNQQTNLIEISEAGIRNSGAADWYKELARAYEATDHSPIE